MDVGIYQVKRMNIKIVFFYKIINLKIYVHNIHKILKYLKHVCLIYLIKQHIIVDNYMILKI